jgi:G3E family GTPase
MKPVPVTVLTGANEDFLATAAPALARAAVVFHDATAGDAGQIAVGCVCCSVRGGLTVTLLDLLRRASRGEVPAFERVVVSAAPGEAVAVLQEFAASPALAIAFRFDALVAVVDDAAEERTDALLADRVLMLGRDVPIEESWLAPAPRAGVRVAPSAIRAAGDDVLQNFVLAWDAAQPLAQLGDWLHTLAAMHGPRILRARGVAAVEGEPRGVALHVLGHVVASPAFLEAGAVESRLAFTVRGLEPGDVLPPWPVAALAA